MAGPLAYRLGMLTNADARDLVHFVGLEWSDADRVVLEPLIDAALVWADEAQMARIAVPIVVTLWADDLEGDILRALESGAARDEFVRGKVADARADVARGPRRSRLARAHVEQAAWEFSMGHGWPPHCLMCVEDHLNAVEPVARRTLAAQVARICTREAALSAEEVRAAITAAALSGRDVATAFASDDRRRAVRARLRTLAELGRNSVPTLAAELLALTEEPLPAAAKDELWREAVAAVAEGLGQEWN